jgi:predicted site-specific integrase-resolvase
MNATPDPLKCVAQDSDELYPQLIPLRTAVTALGITRKTAYQWRDRGKLTFVKQGKRVYCDTAQVLRIKFKQEDETNA